MKKLIIHYGLILFTIILLLSFITVNSPLLINAVSDIDFETLNTRAREEYYLGNLEKSRILYRKLLEYNENRAQTLSNLIIVNKQLGNPRKALKHYRSLIRLEPENPSLTFEYGKTLFQEGSYRKAEAILKELKGEKGLSDRKQALVHYYLGQSLYEQQQYKAALKSFQKGIDHNPELTLNYIGSGDTFKKLKQPNNAINSYQSALNMDSSLSYLYTDIAGLYEKLNRPQQAHNYWVRSRQTDNQTELARSRIEELEQKYPELKPEERELERDKIDWIPVEPVSGDNLPDFRIGLQDEIPEVIFRAAARFRITDSEHTLFTGKGKQEYQIQREQGGFYIYQGDILLKKLPGHKPITINTEDPAATLAVYNINYGSGYFWAGNEDRQYRGKLELFPVDNQLFNLINVVNIQAYLYSVVPSEMPAMWPMEALKSQTVAARSYSLNHQGKYSPRGYDLCSTVACQVYKGVQSEHRRAREAVRATRGEVAVYNGDIIDAVFSSNSGGHTENSQEIWGSELPYLQGRNTMTSDYQDFPLEPYRLENWLLEKPSSYSNSQFTGSNAYRWTRVVTDDYLETRFQLNNLVDVKTGRRTKGGSIRELDIIGENRKLTVSGDSIRGELGGLKSSRFFIEKIYNQGELTRLIFFGGGWGHAVGLDQTAAARMSSEGYDYREILKYFYPGTEIIEKY